MRETWEEAVLRIVRAKDGPITLQEIYQAMECHPLVTPYHKEPWGGQPRFHHWVRSYLGACAVETDGAARFGWLW